MKLTYPEDREARRQALGDGPWNDEPDAAEWESHGFPCEAKRANLGNWCGYVIVPPGHPWHGKSMELVRASVHGGVTWADHANEGDGWRIGFDCAHWQDRTPQVEQLTGHSMGGVYRSFVYVREETEGLAEQAAEAQHQARKLSAN
jgi:hypothetical protein